MTASEPRSDREYFRAIEKVFIELRGAPLLLSPEDWQVARGWRQEGIPVDLVAATLQEVFAARETRAEPDRINSLRYCAPAVRQAWHRLREIQGPGVSQVRSEPGASDLEAGRREALARMAESLPAGTPERDDWARRILSLEGSAESQERALAQIETELAESWLESLTPADRAELEAEVDEAVGRLRGRLSAQAASQVRGQLVRQRLRARYRLQRLTLYP